jgi:PAS domain S-box-containing protein
MQKRPVATAILIASVTLIVLLLNGYYLLQGVTTVLPHLFYIPIILAAYFFPRRGILFACVVSIIYCVMACILTPVVFRDPLSSIGRIVIFLIIAAVVSFLTLRLQENERLFRGVTERSSDVILLTDLGGKAQYVSPSVKAVAGYDPEEILGRMPREFIHPDDYRILAEAIPRIARGSGPVEITLRFQKKTGDYAIVEFSASPIINAGMVYGIQVIGRDLTERRKSEEALRKSAEDYRLLADYTYDWEYWMAPDETFLYTTPSCERITGYSAQEFATDKELLKKIIYPEDRHAMDHHMMHGFKQPEPNAVDFRIIHRNGDIRWIAHVCQPIYNAQGEFIGRRASNRDITERKRIESALKETNKKLNLLSSITRHDINNQIFSLKAFLEISRESLGDPVELNTCLLKAERVTEAIERQIAFTREYQNLGVNAPVWQSVSAAVESAADALPLRDIRIINEVGDLEIYADPLFEKVFYNLIDNALRYGGEKMSAVRFSAQESGPDLVIAVEDDGAGISAGDRQRLFERGFGKHTGLGLFLSREILAITGIRIAETGQPGRGARFEITMPKGTWRRPGLSSPGSVS